jgi:hypothetical protein
MLQLMKTSVAALCVALVTSFGTVGTVLAAPKAPETITISGQMFLQTDDIGPFICGGATVYLFDPYVAQLFATNHQERSKTLHLPPPIAKTTTDADGRFSFTIPKQPYCLYTQTTRAFKDDSGRKVVGFFLWDLTDDQIPDPKNLIITQANMDVAESANRTNVTIDQP